MTSIRWEQKKIVEKFEDSKLENKNGKIPNVQSERNNGLLTVVLFCRIASA